MVKVERSYPAPESLAREKAKKSGTYNTEEVALRLGQDFNYKCYICELGHIQDPQIEHLLPHNGGADRNRMFDWENLFYSCGRCNSIKNSNKYAEGIIDCCKEDPEVFLSQTYSDGDVCIDIRKPTDDPRILRTINLLNDVYNNRKTGIRTLSC